MGKPNTDGRNCPSAPPPSPRSSPVATDRPLAAKLATTGLACAQLGRGPASAASTAAAPTAWVSAATSEADLAPIMGADCWLLLDRGPVCGQEASDASGSRLSGEQAAAAAAVW